MRGVHAEPAHGARLDPPTQHHGPVPAALPALQGHRQDTATGKAYGGTTLLPCVQEVVTPIYIMSYYINWGNYFLDTRYLSLFYFYFEFIKKCAFMC